MTRRLTTLCAAALAALTVAAGVAHADSVTFTLRGTVRDRFIGGDSWSLLNSSGQLFSLASFFCLRPHSECAWAFRFQSGSFGIRVRGPERGSKVALTAAIVDPLGTYARDKGYVRIYFLTPELAKFTFHLEG
jgi:hypothetical protein